MLVPRPFEPVESVRQSGGRTAPRSDARALESAHGIAPLPLTINEYLFSQQQNSAYTAWFLDRLSASGVSAAAHAIWSDCCGAGTLDSLLVGGRRTGQWWAYQAYARLSGRLLATTTGGGVAVAAATDASTHQVLALLGNNSGQGGTTTVTVRNLSAASWLVHGGAVHATVQRIPDQSPPDSPVTVFDADVTPDGGTLHVPVTRTSGSDAYTVTLTPGNGSTGPVDPTVVVDGTDTSTADVDHFGYGANRGVTSGVSDMYQQTANWSYTGGAVATFTFRGTRIALHAVRDTDQGVMSLSVGRRLTGHRRQLRGRPQRLGRGVDQPATGRGTAHADHHPHRAAQRRERRHERRPGPGGVTPS
ncbi:hypothetical protein [Streptomyces sp. NBC_01198]|uniref:hypothetical protein n=1 Tax=Streptomyces sp. NBC_01198 TaxID=2903769 RepID=UPI002E156A15|nr:hypothetical protein OG702_30965 [Streptomyces sp. NBC_01198]